MMNKCFSLLIICEKVCKATTFIFSYTRNARHLADMLAAQPFDPDATLIESIEFAARFPQYAAFSRLESNGLSFVARYSIDVLALLALVATLIAALVLLFVYLLLAYCKRAYLDAQTRRKVKMT